MTTAAARAVRPEDAPLVYQLLQRGRSDNAIATALGVSVDALHVFYRERLIGSFGGGLPNGSLTLREEDVVRLLVKGHSAKEIAQMLFVSYNTVRAHMQSAFRKANCPNKTLLVIWAKENGY